MIEQYITLEDWAKMHIAFSVSKATLHAWAKSGSIVPRPIKLGRRWAVKSNAIYVDPTQVVVSDISDPVIRRILNGG
ncbi:excisionase [Shewanella oncorhynchi]|uniref:excisionase n=1 Tax=Shewanella oncorhynchi TaxID=2726434 RepID=UPI003D79B88A